MTCNLSLYIHHSRGTPGSKSLEKPLAVARELMSAAPPKSPEITEDDHATASTADAEQPTEPEKVSSTHVGKTKG